MHAKLVGHCSARFSSGLIERLTFIQYVAELLYVLEGFDGDFRICDRQNLLPESLPHGWMLWEQEEGITYQNTGGFLCWHESLQDLVARLSPVPCLFRHAMQQDVLLPAILDVLIRSL